MRVLHLVKTSSGARFALLQMRELVNLGIDVHVALPAGGPLVLRYGQYGIKVHFLQTNFPLRNPWRFPQMAGDLRALVADIQPDLIHSHFVGTTLTLRRALGKKNPIPRIFQVPGPLHLEHRFFRHAELATAGEPDYWIGGCQWTTECYRRSGVDPTRVFLGYYGKDWQVFANPTKGKLRQELGLRDDIKIVGMVAYMYPPKRYLGQKRGIKGHEDLIDAIALCSQHRNDIIGVFVGGAWNKAYSYEKQIREYAERKGGDRFVFLGTRNDVLELYPDFDVAVHPSHSENLGGAVESLLLKVPTIATNVGGFPDIVIDGETGWLVPPGRPDKLAEKILVTLDNPENAQELATCGQKRVIMLGDVRSNARKTYQIYQEILSRCHELL